MTTRKLTQVSIFVIIDPKFQYISITAPESLDFKLPSWRDVFAKRLFNSLAHTDCGKTAGLHTLKQLADSWALRFGQIIPPAGNASLTEIAKILIQRLLSILIDSAGNDATTELGLNCAKHSVER